MTSNKHEKKILTADLFVSEATTLPNARAEYARHQRKIDKFQHEHPVLHYRAVDLIKRFFIAFDEAMNNPQAFANFDEMMNRELRFFEKKHES
jgi:hypothetical protein